MQKSRLYRSAVLFVFMISIALSVQAQEKADAVHYGLSLDLYSNVVLRETGYGRLSFVQYNPWISIYGFRYGIISNRVLNDEEAGREFNDFDHSISYAASLGDLYAEIAYIYFTYQNTTDNPETAELYLNFSYPVGVYTLFLYNGFDILKYEGAYNCQIGLQKEFELSKTSLFSVSGYIGAGNGIFNEVNKGISSGAVNDIGILTSLKHKLSKQLFIQPHLGVILYLTNGQSLTQNISDLFNYGIQLGFVF